MSREVETIAIHHTAGPTTQTVASIKRWHTAPKPNGRGWRDIGYHLLLRDEVGPDGVLRCRVWPGRRFDLDDEWEPWEHGAHARGHNHRSIAVAMVGDYSEQAPSVPMRNTLVATLAFLSARWGIDEAACLGHRELSGQATVCPGVSAEWLDQVRSAVGWLLRGEKEGKA